MILDENGKSAFLLCRIGNKWIRINHRSSLFGDSREPAEIIEGDLVLQCEKPVKLVYWCGA